MDTITLKTLSNVTIDLWRVITQRVIGNEIPEEYRDRFQDLFDSVFWDNSFRTLRTVYTVIVETQGTKIWSGATVVESYIKSNAKKIIYMLDTIKDDFLTTETTTTSKSQDDAYNVDYYGGEGQTGKGVAQGASKTIYKDNKSKLWNFSDLADNSLFQRLINILCSTYYIDEEVHW